jgi:LPS O-antigen subunit length determinant protein (WzzB/FepE family)
VFRYKQNQKHSHASLHVDPGNTHVFRYTQSATT